MTFRTTFPTLGNCTRTEPSCQGLPRGTTNARGRLLVRIAATNTLSGLEDLYLPYKPKRRTKATVAREKGLEPLAQFILDQQNNNIDPEAGKYISAEKDVARRERTRPNVPGRGLPTSK